MKKLLALLLVAFMLLAACTPAGPGTGTGTGTTGTDTGTGTAPAGDNDTIVWVQNADITSLDPHVGREGSAISVTVNIYDSMLIMLDDRPQPALAASWEQIDDITWRFFIREDVYFHDGSQLTAEDVAWSVERARDAPQVQYISGFVDHAVVVDEFTVDIVILHPYAPILANLAMPMMAILPRALVEADPDGFFEHPIGTGAYEFVEWNRGQGALLRAFPDYYRGAPRTRYLQMRVVPEPAQRTIALETGQAHLALDVASMDAQRIRDHADLVFIEGDLIATWTVMMNMNNPGLDNLYVREAINYALDIPATLAAVRHNLGAVAHSFIPPIAFGHSTQARQFDHNLDRARELMEQSGVTDLSLDLIVNDAQERIDVCIIIQSQLAQIGIEVNVIVLEFSAFIEATGNGDHDLAFVVWSIPTLDADYNFFSLYHSTQQGAPGNRSFLNDPEVDRLIDTARSIADPAQRQALYDELAVRVGEIVPNAYIFWAGINMGASNSLQGFVPDPNVYNRLYTAWIE